MFLLQKAPSVELKVTNEIQSNYAAHESRLRDILQKLYKNSWIRLLVNCYVAEGSRFNMGLNIYDLLLNE